jgi:tetratricopeptide (TPR) repeat protein
MAISLYRAIYLLLLLGIVAPCIAKSGPNYKWFKESEGEAQLKFDEKECASFANKAAGIKPKYRSFSNNVSSKTVGSGVMRRTQSRSAIKQWENIHRGYTKYCMYHRAYQSATEFKRLPKNLQAEVDKDPKILRLVDEKPMMSYLNAYRAKKMHKAFASSATGAWAWASDRVDSVTAEADAMKDCQENNVVLEKEFPCKLINIDGEWQLSSKATREQSLRATNIKLFKEASAAFDSDDFVKAKKILGMLVLDVSTIKTNSFEEVNRYLFLMDYEKASKVAKELLELNELSDYQKAQMYKLLAEIRLVHDDLDGALVEYKKILELSQE